VIGLRLRVPIACWRKAHAREFIETDLLPPPSTCYGALLSLVGETERKRHVGCRVTAGLLNEPQMSTVLRTFWQIKDRKSQLGNGRNAGPDFQQLVIDADLVVWCDSSDEESTDPLESRVVAALEQPAGVERFGGWSLGESSHLINDAFLLRSANPPASCRVFVEEDRGTITLPVWVDHVGTMRTRYAVGTVRSQCDAPPRGRIPRIAPLGHPS
jgi:CRISPR-associated protein Cas5t